MMMKYEMIDLGLLHHFLGMGVVQTSSSIFIHQKKYASSLLNKFRLNECKTVTTPLVATEKLTKYDGSGATSKEQYISIVEATPLQCDNRYAIVVTKNHVFHQKTKHIDRRYHFIKDALGEGTIDLVYCPTSEELADIFTKPLAKDRFNYLRSMLGVKSAQDLKGSVEL
ncbi:hypothetical protein L3X38_024046 [Prunus dulcis]|uniref:Reverse transcriptase Ty1/copia-type domain-containing protein n=1 Tax=Prunus dulcis TaxID=3755 RepID=A0AAD4VZ22_PRUDU|nr:hypothetical protein L3X38_024046 [Prunus dulcis]